jgi:O-antigen/teichoic acid export membrane protein
MEGHNSTKQIKYGSLMSYLTIFINIILGIVYTPWILRMIGSSHYGLYTLATSLISLFLMDFGMSAAVTRFLAKYRAEGETEKINTFVGFSIKFYLFITAVVMVVLVGVFLNIDRIYGNLTSDELETFKVVFLITAFFLVFCFPVNVCNGILNAYEEFVALKSIDLLNKVGTVVVTVIALIWNGGLYSLILINGAFNLIAFAAKLIVIKMCVPIHASFVHTGRGEVKEVFSFSVWSTIQSISNQAIFNLMPSVLAMVVNTLAITIYGFASQMEGYVYNITSAINGMFIPRISKIIVGKEDAKDVLPLMVKVGRINHSVAMILLIGLTLLGQEFVRLWVGPEYSRLYYCILLLAYPYFITAPQQIAYNSVIVLNKVKYTAIINVAAGILNLCVAYFIAGKFGVVGVCAVTCLVFTLRAVCHNIIYRFVLKIDIWRFFQQCQIKLLLPFFLTCILAYLTIRLIPCPVMAGGVTGWMWFGLKCAIVAVIYVIIMWICGWNKEEKALICSVIKRR